MKEKMKYKLFFLFFFCVVLVGSCGAPPVNTREQRMTLFPDIPIFESTPVSPSFIGMNIEMASICSILNVDSLDRQTYERLYTNLGNGVLHIAGHSGDVSIWQPGAAFSCSEHPIISTASVNAIFAFARRIHWKVIWELPLLNGSPALDASEARYISAVGGQVLMGFTIGNEPDIYVKHRYHAPPWHFNIYFANWENLAGAVLRSVRNAKIFGPDTIRDIKLFNWFRAFLASPGMPHWLSGASNHYYMYDGQKYRHASPDMLLSQTLFQTFAQDTADWVNEASQDHIPFYLTETNTISDGGVQGTSNSFAAALWAANVLFQVAQAGGQQVDFQEEVSVPAVYNAIDDHGLPQNLYYGELFAHLVLSPGASFVTSILNFAGNVSAYALQSGNYKKLSIVLINKESHDIRLSLVNRGPYQKMEVLRLQAPTIASTTGTTINGVSITDGRLPLRLTPSVSLQILDVPADSATAFIFF